MAIMIEAFDTLVICLILFVLWAAKTFLKNTAFYENYFTADISSIYLSYQLGH